MPSAPSRPPAHDSLVDAFLGDLAAAWAYSRSLHAGLTPYAFVLYGVESPTEFTAHVLTEEGLTAVARRYVERESYDTLEEAREALRYAPADAPPPSSDAETDLPTVRALFASYGETVGEGEGYRVLAAAATDALGALDRQGLFGTRAARERILLVILVEGTDEDFSTPSARRLNPPAVFERFERSMKVEGVFAKCE